MYIEEREVGKRTKYYLVHSYRDRDSKVKKLRVFLGSNLSDRELKKERKRGERILKERIKALDRINDPFYHKLTEEERKDIEALEDKIDFDITHLSEDDWENFTEEFSYNTNAIEGSTVTESEVRDILESNKIPESRSEEEIQETYGVSEAISYIRGTKEHISIELIKKIHHVIFKKSKEFAGSFREKGQEVGITDSEGNIIHRGAPPEEIENLLSEMVEWYSKNKNKYSPLVLAVAIHNQFEHIHPFADGNGRVGRLLLNNVLIKHGFPPVDIEVENRQEYYKALRDYDKNRNIRPMMELILKEYKKLRKILGDHKK